MTTRIGKIARLPKAIRDELGRRIEDNELGTDIVVWLNGHEDVKRILAEQFEGRAITEQNLSNWKQTGHPDWLRLQETRDSARLLIEQAGDLDEIAPKRDLSDRFASVLAAEMTRLASALLEQETDSEKRWQRLCQIHRELSQLRRDDHRAARNAIQQERWEAEHRRMAEEEQALQRREARERMIKTIAAPAEIQEMAERHGGSPQATRIARLVYNLKHDLPCDDSIEAIRRDFAPPHSQSDDSQNPNEISESNPIAPDCCKTISNLESEMPGVTAAAQHGPIIPIIPVQPLPSNPIAPNPGKKEDSNALRVWLNTTPTPPPPECASPVPLPTSGSHVSFMGLPTRAVGIRPPAFFHHGHLDLLPQISIIRNPALSPAFPFASCRRGGILAE